MSEALKNTNVHKNCLGLKRLIPRGPRPCRGQIEI
jgi:hypothetical protein